jgi:hypothetical protein
MERNLARVPPGDSLYSCRLVSERGSGVRPKIEDRQLTRRRVQRQKMLHVDHFTVEVRHRQSCHRCRVAHLDPRVPAPTNTKRLEEQSKK